MAIIQGNAKQGSTRGFYPKVINGSLRFNDDDSAYLTWTPASAGNRKTWTWSGWVKRGNLTTGVIQGLFAGNSTASDVVTGLRFEADDTIKLLNFNAGYQSQLITSQVFRDTASWYHIVGVMDTTNATSSDRLRLYVNGQRITAFSTATYPSLNFEGYVNTTNIHVNGAALYNGVIEHLDGYMADTYFIDGQALTADDFGETKNGVWVAKDYAGTFGTNGFYLTFEDDTQVEAFNTVLYRGNGGTQSVTGTGFSPDLVWVKERDDAVSHLLTDTVRGAEKTLSSDSTALEVTGERFVSFDSDGFTVGATGASNGSADKYVAWCWDAGANNAVTGHSSVTYTGNGGTQKISGLPFSPDLVWVKSRTQDEAQNHNLYDTVRGANVRLRTNTTSAEATDNNALMSFDKNGFTLGDDLHHNQSAETYVAWAWDAGDGDPVSNTDGSITSTVKASTANGFSIVSWQANNQTVSTVGHGLSQAPDLVIIKNRSSSTNAQWVVGHSGFGFNGQGYLNLTGAFGTNSGSFNNTAPTSTVFTVGTDQTVNLGTNNYIAYCFHDVTGKQKFGTYTGNGSTSGPTVTTGFRPGWLLIKRTDSASVNGWYLYDGSRNTFSPWGKILLPNSSGAEGDNTDDLIISDTGFTLNDAYVDINASGGTYIYAAFAGSYSDYITDYNTDGSIDSRVKASDTTGFSIVSYTGNATNGATVGHGLSSTPDMILIKNRNSARDWIVYHSSIASLDQYLHLNDTGGLYTSSGIFSAPTSSVFGFTTSYNATNAAEPIIAYCWSETTGYSKFGSYTGNGSTTGPSITCGFKPAMVILKRTDSGGSWTISDNTRDTVNPVTPYLFPHASDAEATDSSNEIDFNSNGFQIKHDTRNNTSGATYIYAAFADTREAAFWLDQSGNDNDWQPVNLDHNDTVADSPTNNFATWNPLFRGGEKSSSIAATSTLSDGNLKVSVPTNSYMGATMRPTSGQYYCEATINTVTNEIGWGWIQATEYSATTAHAGQANKWGAEYSGYAPADIFLRDETTAIAQPTITLSNGDVIQWAWDIDAGKGWIGVNNNWYDSSGGTTGNPSTGVNPTFTFTADEAENLQVYVANGTGTAVFTANFGQQPFKYDPPE